MYSDYKKIKTLLIYQGHRKNIDKFYENYISRLNRKGFDVKGFCLTIDPSSPRLNFEELDAIWRKRDKRLISLYSNLIEAIKDREVTILFNGANLHPQFLKETKTFNAYMCFDDPESSKYLSEPVAKHFDCCFVGNIAALNMYKVFGCKNIFFRPLGYWEDNVYSQTLTDQDIMKRRNEIDVCLFCERESKWRKERLEYLEKNISGLYARGRGWQNGWINDEEMLNIISRSKIGLNIHNSVGPVNLRTFSLPANGVMQICDNKFFLGHIFELNKEVVGFTDIQEVPALVKYYLEHEEQRIKIALAGWKRAVSEYNEISVWSKQMAQINSLI